MVAGKKDKCVKGVSCGLSCIHSYKTCLEDLPEFWQKELSKRAEAKGVDAGREAIMLMASQFYNSKNYKTFVDLQNRLDGATTEEEVDRIGHEIAKLPTVKGSEERFSKLMSELDSYMESNVSERKKEAMQRAVLTNLLHPYPPRKSKRSFNKEDAEAYAENNGKKRLEFLEKSEVKARNLMELAKREEEAIRERFSKAKSLEEEFKELDVASIRKDILSKKKKLSSYEVEAEVQDRVIKNIVNQKILSPVENLDREVRSRLAEGKPVNKVLEEAERKGVVLPFDPRDDGYRLVFPTAGQWNDYEVSLLMRSLPDGGKRLSQRAGQCGGRKYCYGQEDGDLTPRGNGLARLYLEQNGFDPVLGTFLPLSSMEPEHTAPQEQHRFADFPTQMTMSSPKVNNLKSSGTFAEKLSNLKGYEAGDWDREDRALELKKADSKGKERSQQKGEIKKRAEAILEQSVGANIYEKIKSIEKSAGVEVWEKFSGRGNPGLDRFLLEVTVGGVGIDAFKVSSTVEGASHNKKATENKKVTNIRARVSPQEIPLGRAIFLAVNFGGENVKKYYLENKKKLSPVPEVKDKVATGNFLDPSGKVVKGSSYKEQEQERAKVFYEGLINPMPLDSRKQMEQYLKDKI